MKQWEHCRNYEISVWTLQDSYIATLKSGDPILKYDSASSAANWEIWPQARAQGQIQNGMMEINIDGTQTLSFDIPMYLFVNGKKIENPNWYNTINKNILVSMRKIKVIFDKYKNLGKVDPELEEVEDPEVRSDSVFEFIITKVQETHEQDNLVCHVECEGLAFHELGKIGYKISLSSEEYFRESREYERKEAAGENPNGLKPFNNIQYWLSKAGIDPMPKITKMIDTYKLNPNKWYYVVRMAHTSILTTEQHYSDRIYEDGVITDWDDDGLPSSYTSERELARLMDVSESNLYNITQDLAETFNVFCRYQYLYNTNYNIIGRVIVFYNNFLQESKDVATLMYPNSANKISREMDSTDISTKMFVRSVDNADLYTGAINIMDCSANKSQEDYVMNFDYLYDIGTISREQYKGVSAFEKDVRAINKKIVPIQNSKRTLDNLKVNIDAMIKSLTKQIELDSERITENEALMRALDEADGEADGYITIDHRNPTVLTLMKDSSNPNYDTYYVKLDSNDKCMGIKPDTLKLYKDYHVTSTANNTQQAIAFKSYTQDPNDPGAPTMPSNWSGWKDYSFKYKATIGQSSTINKLPSNPKNGDYYKANNKNYPSGYNIKVGQYLQYNESNKKWEVKSGLDESGSGYKGTIGEKYDLEKLPSTSEAKAGWIYILKTANYNYVNTSSTSYTYRSGSLVYYDGADWILLKVPNEEYVPALKEEKTEESFKAHKLYILENNEYKLPADEATFNEKADYYICIDYTKAGYILLQHTKVYQRNGPCREFYTAKRDEQKGTTPDYISNMRKLYYVTTKAKIPSKPTVETKTSDATEIASNEVLDKWSSYISSPQFLSDISKYYINSVWETTYAQGKKKYSSVVHSRYDGTQAQSGDPVEYDADHVLIGDAAQDRNGNLLKEEERLYGQYVYDEYHNLSMVTGLFRSEKQGNYSFYKDVTQNTTYNPSYSSITVNNINNLVNVNETVYPSELSSKCIVVRTQTQCGNGNVKDSYSYQYYDANGVIAVPENANTKINTIIPIYYTQTNDTVPSLSSPPETIFNSNKNNKWTTSFPEISKTQRDKKGYKCYQAWQITSYNNETKYIGPTEITSIIKVKKSSDDKSDPVTIPKQIYAVYKYKPDLYYEKIKQTWIQKQYSDQANLVSYQKRIKKVNELIEQVSEQLEMYLAEKSKLIADFEHSMGAALRESYWQPEDEYQDYGTEYKETLTLHFDELYTGTNMTTYFNNMTEKHLGSIGWDSSLFEDEQNLYYESGIKRDRVYYPCINLTKLKNPLKPDNDNNSDQPFLNLYATESDTEKSKYTVFFSSVISQEYDTSADKQDIRYCQQFAIGSTAKFAFLRKRTDRSHVIPVLMLTDVHSLPQEELDRIYLDGKIGYVENNVASSLFSQGATVASNNSSNYILEADNKKTYFIGDAWMNGSLGMNSDGQQVWIEDNTVLDDYEIVYPRIMIPSLKLKVNGDDITLAQLKNNESNLLTQYDDYYIFTKTYYNSTNSQNSDYSFTLNSIQYKKYKYRDIEKVSINKLQKARQVVTWYTITIKPEYIFAKTNLSPLIPASTISPYPHYEMNFKIVYHLSNADLDIYCDAKNILKENAYPKVSYDIEVSKWTPDLLNGLYTKLAQLVMINDADLKLQNTFGYISSIKLDLDHEEKDSVEVKNYKTKFEDLFSMIVAETEEMHKNSHNIGLAGALASGGSISSKIDPEGMEATLADPTIQEMLYQFLDEYFDGAEVVQKQLQELWGEAGAIMGSAASSLNSVMGLTTKNANILASFRENVAEALTPNIFTGKTQPTNFKPGDIWMNQEDGYFAVATGLSNEHGGFTRTHDGKLAEISGASMEIDAEKGTIDILAQTQINLMSGKDIYIAAGDTVNIVGNKEVNIGGTRINMATSNIIGEGYPGEEGIGGIHLVTTDYFYHGESTGLSEGSSSYVDIGGEGIELASKNGIVIKSGAGIDIKSSDNENVSAVQIDKDKGIYLGSTQKVSLFSGDISDLEHPVGASVELSKDHLLLGMANIGVASATALEMTTDQIILAAGEHLDLLPKNNKGELIINDIIETTVTSGNNTYNLAGIQIKSNYIGMTTGQGQSRSIISIKPDQIKLGQMNLISGSDASKPESYYGSYLWLAKDEIYIGTMGNFTLNTNNIKIQSKNLSEAKGTSKTDVNGMGFALGMSLQKSNPEVGLGFWIKKTTSGDTTTYEKHLVVDGDITAQTFTAISNNGKFIANGNKFGLYNSAGTTGLLTIDSSGNIISGGDLQLSAHNLKINIWEGDSDDSSEANRKFMIDTTRLKTNHDNYIFAIYTSEEGGWSNAQAGVRFGIDGGLQIKVKQAVNIQVGNSSLESWSLSLITPELILQKVQNALNESYVKIEADKITIGSTGGLIVDTKNFDLDEDGNVTIIGNITATSFTLGAGAEIPWSKISDKPTIPNPDDFKIDGLSTNYRKVDTSIDTIDNISDLPIFSSSQDYAAETIVRRNTSTNKNVYKFKVAHPAGDWDSDHADIQYRRTVELTSSSALVLGANAGIYVIDDNNSTLVDTKVSINKSNINLDISANNYIHMSKSGIEMKGKRITIDGNPIWARDDIIILSQNEDAEDWRKTVKKIENHMKVGTDDAVHDWVLIKPYYNAEWNSETTTFNDRGRRIPTAEGGDPVTFLNQITCPDDKAFGTLLEPNGYHYTANIELLGIDNDNDSAGPNSVTVVITNDTLNLSVTITVPVNGVTLHHNITTPFSKSIDSSINLCREGTKISATATASSAVMLKAAFITFSCNSVKSRVPCTVYYYP